MHTRIRLLGCLPAAVLALAAPAAAAAADDPPRTAEAQILAINDFHGALEGETAGTVRETSTDPEAIKAGGADYLATYVRRLRRENPRNTLTVSAGDLIGASPLTSALFHDEPTIKAMNRIGLDLNAVGNHEFDEGADELLRMQRGGCHRVDGCTDVDQDGRPDRFRGAKFRFLAANVVRTATGRTLFRPYAIRRLGGVRVGFIGLTLEGTPDVVAAAGIQGLEFRDEADTINHYARVLRRRGVEAIVVLLHQGGQQTAPFNVNGCNGLNGPIVDIVNRTTDAVDLFITGHTHQVYNCVIDGRPVTSALSNGRVLTDLDLTLDQDRRDIVQIRADNEIVRQVAPDGTPVARAPDISGLIAQYQALAAPIAQRVIGHLSGPATRATDDSGENQAGNLIADSQLAATAGPAGAVAAFMNPGGVRTDFPGGEVTYSAAFQVQPFGNTLVTLTLTGTQVLDLLKQQWCGQTGARVLLPSGTVHYAYSASVAAQITGQPCEGAPNPVSGLTIAGQPVDPAAAYRITVNSFLADGGDNFTVLRAGTERTGGGVDLDALAAYLAANDPLTVPALDRIDVTP
jgi:5'-nucleotidase